MPANAWALERYVVSVVLITGAGGGLGRAMAVRLARDGHSIAACDFDGTALAQTVDDVRATGADAVALVADLRESTEIDNMFRDAAKALGPVGILVNNAAIYPSRPFVEVSVREYDDVVRVNQRAYFLAAQHAAPTDVRIGQRCNREHFFDHRFRRVGEPRSVRLDKRRRY